MGGVGAVRARQPLACCWNWGAIWVGLMLLFLRFTSALAGWGGRPSFLSVTASVRDGGEGTAGTRGNATLRWSLGAGTGQKLGQGLVSLGLYSEPEPVWLRGAGPQENLLVHSCLWAGLLGTGHDRGFPFWVVTQGHQVCPEGTSTLSEAEGSTATSGDAACSDEVSVLEEPLLPCGLPFVHTLSPCLSTC